MLPRGGGKGEAVRGCSVNEMLAAAQEEGRRRGRSDAESDLLRPNTDHAFGLYESPTAGLPSGWLATTRLGTRHGGSWRPAAHFRAAPTFAAVARTACATNTRSRAGRREPARCVGATGPCGVRMTCGCLTPRGCRMHCHTPPTGIGLRMPSTRRPKANARRDHSPGSIIDQRPDSMEMELHQR